MKFALPVAAPLHPLGWQRPPGSTEFAITRDCAGHRATNQGCALDIGNRRCDGKVYAAASGRVVYVQALQGIVRIDHGTVDGHRWRSDYAHMVPILVRVGDTVHVGQQIGEVGDAHDPAIGNFSGCHLHFAIVEDGVEVDPEPLLKGDEEVKVEGFADHVANRKATLRANTNFRDAPRGSAKKLTTFGAGTVVIPNARCVGDAVGNAPDAADWYRATLYVSEPEPGVERGWNSGFLHSSGFPHKADGTVDWSSVEPALTDEAKAALIRQGATQGARIAAADVVAGAQQHADKYQ